METPHPFGDRLPVLETPRLRLRHPRSSDADDLHAIFSDPVAMRYWSTEPHASLDVSRQYITAIDKGFAERSLFQWAITEPATDGLIGTVTLTAWDETNRHAELGYMLKPSHWGQGLASEAVRAVLDFAFPAMNLNRVEAELDPRNVGSARLLEKLGFAYEGLMRQRWFLYDEWCDSAFYGLLAADYEPA